jgi:hypothetical protein
MRNADISTCKQPLVGAISPRELRERAFMISVKDFLARIQAPVDTSELPTIPDEMLGYISGADFVDVGPPEFIESPTFSETPVPGPYFDNYPGFYEVPMFLENPFYETPPFWETWYT